MMGRRREKRKTFIDWEANVSPLISPHTHYCHNHTIGAGKLIMRGSPFVCSLSLALSSSLSPCMCMCVFFRTNDCSFDRKHSRTHMLNQGKTTGYTWIHHTLAKRVQGSLHHLLLFLLILLSETLKGYGWLLEWGESLSTCPSDFKIHRKNRESWAGHWH